MKKFLVIGFNVVACLVLLEAFAAFALKQVEGRWLTPARYVASLGIATPEENGAEGAIAARQNAPRWMIQPYFGYARNPDVRMTHFNGIRIRDRINEHGLFGPSPVPQRSDERFVVALTGGSVALELYLHTRGPLIEELEILPAARGKQVEIVCLALGGMKQPQQVVQLNYFLALGAAYDLVVNLDGFNEVALPLAENLSRGVNPFFPRNWATYSATSVDLETATIYGRQAELGNLGEERTRRFLASPLRWTFARSLVHARRRTAVEGEILSNEMRLRELMGTETLAPQQRGPLFPYGNRKRALPELVSMWKNASIQMSHTAEGLGIPYFHFLQPNQYVAGSKPFDEWELTYAINPQAEYAKNAIPGYPLLIAAGGELVASGVSFFDLTGIYGGIREPIYRDNCCHVNDEGGEIMARAIGRRIVESYSSTRR